MDELRHPLLGPSANTNMLCLSNQQDVESSANRRLRNRGNRCVHITKTVRHTTMAVQLDGCD